MSFFPVCHSLHRGSRRSTRFPNGVFFKEAGDQSRIQICPDLNDLVPFEPANPTVPVVKSEAILRGSEGMQFNNGPVPARQRVFYVQLRALRQDLVKFFESVR
jgi:hypothetical protein